MITEGLLDFTGINHGTVRHPVDTIKQQLQRCGLNSENVAGQMYDTTAAISSENRGFQTLLCNSGRQTVGL